MRIWVAFSPSPIKGEGIRPLSFGHFPHKWVIRHITMGIPRDLASLARAPFAELNGHGFLIVDGFADGMLVDEVPVVGYAHSGTFGDLDFAVFIDGVDHVGVAVEVDGRV